MHLQGTQLPDFGGRGVHKLHHSLRDLPFGNDGAGCVWGNESDIAQVTAHALAPADMNMSFCCAVKNRMRAAPSTCRNVT